MRNVNQGYRKARKLLAISTANKLDIREPDWSKRIERNMRSKKRALDRQHSTRG